MSPYEAAEIVKYLDRMIPRRTRTNEQREEAARSFVRCGLTGEQVRAIIDECYRTGECKLGDAPVFGRIRTVSSAQNRHNVTGTIVRERVDNGGRVVFREWFGSESGREFVEQEAAGGNKFAAELLRRANSRMAQSAITTTNGGRHETVQR